MEATRVRPTRRYLLIEVALVLVLIVLTILFYLRPAADGEFSPQWWHAASLALLFFTVVGLHTWRRKRGL